MLPRPCAILPPPLPSPYYLQPGFDSLLKPMSPQYWLKLKKGAALAQVGWWEWLSR